MMSTFLCVLLLGVILVASVQGLTEDQLQQILGNDKGAPASDDVGWYHKTKTRKGAPASDDVGWYHKTKTRKGAPASDNVGWLHVTKTSKDPAPWCQSHISGADCCLQRTMHAHGRTYHLNACVNVDFHPHANEYSVYFSVNGYSLFHKDTDLKMNEMEECFSASQLAPGAKICIKLYKISTKRKRMCAALDGKAVIKGVENKVQLDYGCFQIGSGDENEDEQVPVGMETEEQATNAEMYRALSDQLDQRDGGEETTSTEDDTLRF
ncbi:uncharacterized protein LOC128207527 isoform X3 [Mya arenaria]|uniref:uncharacterized protein LOC128207527 isoform X2 n=1 Tax=Mya arenaria TaxID=6604 RepID=UPI0022E32F95|nr:uncharacterized protein LOC128207527 isoform X2 [Mya arenaria]XP_052766444.1 uncharacterized protein LOC128207527 isoform X3 [Mya arenaria]